MDNVALHVACHSNRIQLNWNLEDVTNSFQMVVVVVTQWYTAIKTVIFWQTFQLHKFMPTDQSASLCPGTLICLQKISWFSLFTHLSVCMSKWMCEWMNEWMHACMHVWIMKSIHLNLLIGFCLLANFFFLSLFCVFFFVCFLYVGFLFIWKTMYKIIGKNAINLP